MIPTQRITFLPYVFPKTTWLCAFISESFLISISHLISRIKDFWHASISLHMWASDTDDFSYSLSGSLCQNHILIFLTGRQFHRCLGTPFTSRDLLHFSGTARSLDGQGNGQIPQKTYLWNFIEHGRLISVFYSSRTFTPPTRNVYFNILVIPSFLFSPILHVCISHFFSG